MEDIKFKDLNNGDSFECWGDTHLNYNYAKWCKCVKINDDTGQEVDGINFAMNDNDIVYIKKQLTKQ